MDRMARVQHEQDLLAWFDRHRRDLPWRRSRDPYGIWLSEVMLQQTRVEVVIPYYERFLKRFPTIETLAAADLEEVLTLWSGLGYYRRARQLHAAAQQVAAAGGFPRTVEGWLELPGIGPYTAAAVTSQAFGVVSPVLDGNVERVLSRWLALGEDPKSSGARRQLLTAAASLLDVERPGDSNQALMELGATLCTPRNPKCLLCPISSGCLAAAAGEQEAYPVARAKRQGEKQRLVVAVAERGGGVLLFRRPDDSVLLAGTWELPWVRGEGVSGIQTPEAELATRYGGIWRLGPRIAEVRHGITYRDLEIAVHQAQVEELMEEGRGLRSGGSGEAWGWFDAQGRAGLPLSSLIGKVLRKVAGLRCPGAAVSAPHLETSLEISLEKSPVSGPGAADARPARRSRSRRPG